jgi:hypothetical protein
MILQNRAAGEESIARWSEVELQANLPPSSGESIDAPANGQGLAAPHHLIGKTLGPNPDFKIATISLDA